MDVLFWLREYSTTLVLVTTLLITLYLFGRRTFSQFKAIGVHGPVPISHLGNLMEMKKLTFNKAFKVWREKYGDIYGVYFGVLPMLVICDPEIIQEILVKRFSNFTNRALIVGDEISKASVAAARDDHWKYLRTVLTPSFTSSKMRAMNVMIQKCADRLVANISKLAEKGEATEVKKLFSAYTMDVICATGFGMDVDSQQNPDDPFVQKANEIFKISLFNPILFLLFLLPSSANFIEKSGLVRIFLGNQIHFRKFCRKLIEERKKRGIDNEMQRNLLGLMIKAQLKGHETLPAEAEKELQLENVTDWRTKRGITDKEILAQCLIAFLAGFESTATTLNFFSYLMTINPEAQQKVYEEIENVLAGELPDYDNVQKLTYLEMCMDETLRLYPFGTQLNREANKTCTIKGLTIPKGLAVRISVDAIHYNPKYWPKPEEFIPERFSEEGKAKQVPFTYLPFGGGPRICLGMRLAKLEFKIAAVQMIRNFKLLPTEKTEVPLVLSEELVLKAKNGIWVKFERR
ncbi:cytochrome P450 3A24-like [Argonauta hians]